MSEEALLDFASDDTLAGYRLKRLELYNWGTFHNRIWELPLDGSNGLLTGDIGSGKSTVVDAVTTLLVPAAKVSYNKAAGASFRERDLKSYVLGYYKSERSESGLSARPVALRSGKSYSVILGVFDNRGYGKTVTLAQVFWQKEAQGQPARFYLVSDEELNIAEHFSHFGRDIKSLRKRLRGLPGTEALYDSFPPYGAAFRRRFGLKSDQALELFHQTVSMKTVGNLTDFVREHMLESFDVAPRIEALITHFEDLNRAHAAVLTAKDQISRLRPLAESLSAHSAAVEERDRRRTARDGLSVFFADRKLKLLEKRIAGLNHEIDRGTARRSSIEADLAGKQAERDELKQSIAENGGDRLEALRRELSDTETRSEERKEQDDEYAELCGRLGFPPAGDTEEFIDNLRRATEARDKYETERNSLQNRRKEDEYDFQQLRRDHRKLAEELESLRSRKNNIDPHQIRIREGLCSALEIDESELPFAGELISVREEEAADWEGAIERLLRSFGLSLLVPDRLYAEVAAWVDRTDLKGRLIYYRIREEDTRRRQETSDAASLIRKLETRPDSPFKEWLGGELRRRFDYTCCSNLEEFRRAGKGITRTGQIKGSPVRHEKDDRHALNDRRRYILGWKNEAKIHALENDARKFEQAIADAGAKITELQHRENNIEERLGDLIRLESYKRFEQIDWRPLVLKIEELKRAVRELEETSDILKTLHHRLDELEERIREADGNLDQIKDAVSRNREKLDAAEALSGQTRGIIEESPCSPDELNPLIAPLYSEALGTPNLTVESCDNREKELRNWIQAKIDADEKRIERLQQKIISSMQEFKHDYQAETAEMDASIEAGDEYRSLLASLEADDLPAFESRFKELLNENTIREIANFQAQLNKEAQIIRERVDRINQSMSAIEYNKDRYILLELESTPDPEVRGFRQDLRSCTEGSFTGSDQEQYTESKFLQVRAIIDRFKGREGSSDLDRRWTDKVTDVRNWFTFAASERWNEDDSEYEHYTDSGGKSGGQKEKLAYTVLAASLAYQFGLEWGETRSRSFRFVVIDEAFGRGSDDSARYGLKLFRRLNLQLLIITPLQKIHIIEPFVSTVGFVHNEGGRKSLLRCLTIEEYRDEMAEVERLRPGNRDEEE